MDYGVSGTIQGQQAVCENYLIGGIEGCQAEEGSISSHKRREGVHTLSNSSGCKRQLSRRHVLADWVMVRWVNKKNRGAIRCIKVLQVPYLMHACNRTCWSRRDDREVVVGMLECRAWRGA